MLIYTLCFIVNQRLCISFSVCMLFIESSAGPTLYNIFSTHHGFHVIILTLFFLCVCFVLVSAYTCKRKSDYSVINGRVVDYLEKVNSYTSLVINYSLSGSDTVENASMQGLYLAVQFLLNTCKDQYCYVG